MGICGKGVDDVLRKEIVGKNTSKIQDNLNDETISSSKNIIIPPMGEVEKTSEKNTSEGKKQENEDEKYMKKKKELEDKEKQIEKDTIKFVEEKREYEKKKSLEKKEREIAEKKAKLEEDKRRMEEKRKLDEENREIEKKRKEIEEIQRKIEEDKRKELEKKEMEEKRIEMEVKKAKIEEQKRIAENQKFIEEQNKEKRGIEEFYDMILYFDSFEQLKKDGWNAKFTKLGKKKFEKCLDNKSYNIVIGIVGNKNRGKSYLLGRIMKIKDYKNPHGFQVTTKGISSVFPKLDNTNKTFITLDTAGNDNPLLNNTFFDEKDKNELIRNIARDQKAKEIAVNDFIIEESDVLITVLEQLSFSEQEMLKNLINQINNFGIKNMKKSQCTPKRLIVIHNLMNIKTVEGIDKFIKEVLLKSLTFPLDEQVNEETKFTFYIQNLNQDKDNNQKRKPYIEIVHLIVGNDETEEIKTKFNEPAFEFIRKNITTRVGKKFNILEKFKNFIIENSKNYFEGDKFDQNSLIIGTETEEDGKIKIPISLNPENPELTGKNLKFKKYYINARGIHHFSSVLEPRYSTNVIELEGKNYIEIEFELSGNVEIKEVNPEIDKEQYLITIKGTTDRGGENLQPRDFEFQPVVNMFIPGKDEELQIIIQKKEKEIIDHDDEFGIHNIRLPIRLRKKPQVMNFQKY